MGLETLKKMRKNAKLTQKDMGKLLDMSGVGYRKIEVGETELTYSNALKLAKKLNKRPEQIFLPTDLTKS